MSFKERWWKSAGKRTAKEGEDLAGFEMSFITQTGKCPDCKGELLAGPRGGAAQMFCCGKCNAEFTITKMSGVIVDGQRASDKGPREIGDRAQFYGLAGSLPRKSIPPRGN